MSDVAETEDVPPKKVSKIPWRDLLLQFLSVTFGVILAFQLTSWKEGQEESEAFERLLGRVAIENRQNLKYISQEFEAIEGEQNSLEDLLAGLEEKDISPDSLAGLLGGLLGLSVSNFSTANLAAAVSQDNSGYQMDIIPFLNDLMTREGDLQDIEDLRVNYFMDKLIPALENDLDFNTNQLANTKIFQSLAFKNKVMFHYGTGKNKDELLRDYFDSVQAFDSVAVERGWIE